MIAASCLILASFAGAQSEDSAPLGPQGGSSATPVPLTNPQMALGTLLQGPIDVMNTVTAPPTPGTIWNRQLGCARAWGYYWVSGGAGTTGAFAIHQFDPTTGAYIQSFPQTVFSATVWGARDLAANEAAFKLYGGMEGNVLAEYTFNPAGGPNGTLTFTTSYTISGGPGTIRALAFNPNTGRFFTKNFNNNLQEFTLVPPAVFLNHNANGKSSYGLAYDALNNTLWQFDQNIPGGGATTTDGVEFNETDLTGLVTGRTFVGTVYGVSGTNIAGGCDMFVAGGVTRMLALHQNTVDELDVYEVDSLTPPPTAYCTSSSTTNNCTPAMAASGTPSAAAASGFTLTCNNVEGQKLGLIFYGIAGQNNVSWGTGSTSFLCVKTPTQRMTSQNSGGTPGGCDGTISQDFLAFIAGNPGALGAPFSAGAVVDAQCWFRDPPAVKTTNLSNGIEWTMVP